METSLLSREESNAVKGVLILLVILGHDIPFVRLTDPWMVMVWIYLFHIHSFFLLPYLYPLKKLSRGRLRDSFIRFYVPFLVLSFVLMALRLFSVNGNGMGLTLPEVLLGLVGGSPEQMKSIFGVQFPWFLPAMFMAGVVREAFMAASPVCKGLLFIMGCFSILLVFLPFISIPATCANLALSLRFLVMGLLVRKFCEKGWFGNAALVSILLSGSICFFVHYRCCLRPFHYGYPMEDIYKALRFIMTASFVMFLWGIRTLLAKSSFLVEFGKYSFSIYMLHAFIGYFVNWTLSWIGVSNWLSAFICLITVAGASFLGARIIERMGKLQALFMPKGWQDFADAWHRICRCRSFSSQD